MHRTFRRNARLPSPRPGGVAAPDVAARAPAARAAARTHLSRGGLERAASTFSPKSGSRYPRVVGPSALRRTPKAEIPCGRVDSEAQVPEACCVDRGPNKRGPDSLLF